MPKSALRCARRGNAHNQMIARRVCGGDVADGGKRDEAGRKTHARRLAKNTRQCETAEDRDPRPRPDFHVKEMLTQPKFLWKSAAAVSATGARLV